MLAAKSHNKLKIAILYLSTGINQETRSLNFSALNKIISEPLSEGSCQSFYKECVLKLHEKTTMYF